MDFPFSLIITRKRVKYLRLKIAEDATVHLTLPLLVSESKGLEFVEQKKDWILKSLQKKKESSQNFFSFDGFVYTSELSDQLQSGKVIVNEGTVLIGARNEREAKIYFQEFLKREGQKILPQELEELSMQTGLQYKNLTLRSQRSRWGSCSNQKNISLNTALMRLSKELREYVLIHELCHTQQMNHSQKFWRLVERFCPKYKSCKKELKKYGLSIF